uniref:Uncharacterized protein n=1 Tax=Daphnia magna TaxID=35525 RepID=A0A0P6JSM6_9CRUS
MLSVTRNLNIYKIANTKTENKWDKFERHGSYRKQERRHSVKVDVYVLYVVLSSLLFHTMCSTSR